MNYLTNTSLPSVRDFLLSCWSEKFNKLPKQLAYFCCPEAEEKHLLMKTQCMLDKGLELELD